MKFKEVNKLFDLSGKVIVLTGSAGLLGSQYADILSDAGAKLVLVDKNSKQKKIQCYASSYGNKNNDRW